MGSRLPFRVLHTVVQHALCAQHSGHVLDGGPEAVWRVIARAFVVAVVIVEFLAISAKEGVNLMWVYERVSMNCIR